MKGFTDGLSKTIMFAESADARPLIEGRITAGFYRYLDAVAGTGRDLGKRTSATGRPDPNTEVLSESSPGTGSFSSSHTGGLFGVTMADGSTRFVNYGISNTLFGALLTRSKGDAVTDDF